MKKILYVCLAIVTILLIPQLSYANDAEQSNSTNHNIDTEAILEEQKSSFGIRDFLKDAENYAPDFMKELDISNMFDKALTGDIDNSSIFKKILNLLGSQIIDTLKILINILIIVLIHSILKSVTDSLEGSNVSKIVYYVQYILIVTIIMANFSDILKSVNETIENLIGFSELLIPLLVTLMTYTGSITTTAVIQPILLFLIEIIANLIKIFVLPIVALITVLAIISKITDKMQINQLGKFMKSSVVWVLGVILTVFVGVVSLEGTLTASVDGVTAKTAKAAVSNLIPVVGKILGDGVDSILGCGVILKNAVGMIGVIIIIGICFMPIIKIGTFSILYSLTSSIIEPLADTKIVKLLEEMGGIFKLLFAIVCSVSVLLIIGITLVIKISNSGMMYR